MRTAKTQSRLGGCPSWSESSLGAHVILLVLSCAGYNVIIYGSIFGIMDTFYSAKRFAAPFWEGVCSKRGANPFLTEKLHFQKRLVYRKANRKSKKLSPLQKKKKKSWNNTKCARSYIYFQNDPQLCIISWFCALPVCRNFFYNSRHHYLFTRT